MHGRAIGPCPLPAGVPTAASAGSRGMRCAPGRSSSLRSPYPPAMCSAEETSHLNEELRPYQARTLARHTSKRSLPSGPLAGLRPHTRVSTWPSPSCRCSWSCSSSSALKGAPLTPTFFTRRFTMTTSLDSSSTLMRSSASRTRFVSTKSCCSSAPSMLPDARRVAFHPLRREPGRRCRESNDAGRSTPSTTIHREDDEVRKGFFFHVRWRQKKQKTIALGRERHVLGFLSLCSCAVRRQAWARRVCGDASGGS